MNLQDDKIIVSELMKFNSFYIGDFIYFGPTFIFSEFISSQLNYQIIHPIIANNIGFNYYIKLKRLSRRSLLFLYLGNSKKCESEWSNFVDLNIDLIPFDCYSEIFWRNKRIGEIIDETKFLFKIKSGNLFPVTSENSTKIIYLLYGLKMYFKRVVKTLIINRV